MNRIATLTGYSGAGKTTAICALIRHFTDDGKSVGAIKHTHHKLNEIDKGDTAEFRRAGADPVILAGDGEAVIFSAAGTQRVRFARPADLLQHFTSDIILVEGFRSYDAWPRIEIDANARKTTPELLSILESIWRS